MEQAPVPERPESVSDIAEEVRARLGELRRIFGQSLAVWKVHMPHPNCSLISAILLHRSSLQRLRQRYANVFRDHPVLAQLADDLADFMRLDPQAESILDDAQRRHTLLPRGGT